jgi:expansin
MTSGGPPPQPAGSVEYTPVYNGGEYHLGPVDFEETKWHNACASAGKYPMEVRQVEGNLLAGLWGGLPNVAGYCDACISVTTEKGKKAVLRVVTYGDTTQNSIDVSPEAYALLHSNEYPRKVSWQFVKCPDTGKLMYEFQTQASEYWTSLWVRNARVPIKKVEVKSQNHVNYKELRRETDGTLNDDAGFGKGPFTLRITGIDGSMVEDTLEWPSDGIAGKLIKSQKNFQ